jgi:ComF family protein
MGSEDTLGVYTLAQKIMNFLSILKDIFLEENERRSSTSSPKNLTVHYRQELRHVEYDEVCVWADYREWEKEIERYKYHSDRHISTDLVEVLSKCVEVSVYYGEHDDWVIIPIPMHWSRYMLRGFDHTKRLATELAHSLWIEYNPILKTKWRRRQSNLSRTKRLENKKDSFLIKNGYTIPSHIILIDDVVSSSSTFHEAARVLRAHGAEKVICFAIASNA